MSGAPNAEASVVVVVVVASADEAVRGRVAAACSGVGHRVLEAGSVDEAVALVDDHSEDIDVMLADAALLDDGAALEAMRRLRRSSASAHMALFLVAHGAGTAGAAGVAGARELGALGVIERSIEPAALAATLRAAAEPARIIRSLRAQLRTAERHAAVDPLTGLGNRRSLRKRLLEESAFARRHRAAFSVVLLDLDRFKRVNDTYGHDEGDRVLAFFASRFAAVLRAEDVAFRYGGEEFVLLLRSCGDGRAVDVTQRLRDDLGATPFQLSDGTRSVIAFSAGVAAATAAERYSGEELVTRADDALYRAKREGRNRTVIADALESMPALPAPVAEHAALVMSLRQARALIASPERWLAAGFAQDREGRWRPVGSDDAASFSVIGALLRVGGTRGMIAAARAAFDAHAPVLYATVVLATGKPPTHANALGLLDATIAGLSADLGDAGSGSP